MQTAQISLILIKTAIFTAVAPFTIGWWLPLEVHRRYDRPDDALPAYAARVILSLAFLLMGAVTYLWCAWDFSVKGLGTPAPIDAPKNLVVNGLYCYVRNPMYLGVFLLVASRAVFFWSLAIFLYLVLVAVCFHLFILWYEEPHLQKVFGRPYLDYCRRVPRWIPRSRPLR
jgi:protein-S-isoprenylcysteine O-methyltransferase Ste14